VGIRLPATGLAELKQAVFLLVEGLRGSASPEALGLCKKAAGRIDAIEGREVMSDLVGGGGGGGGGGGDRACCHYRIQELTCVLTVE